jgi:hypothetical protein
MISGTISVSDYLSAQRLHLGKTLRWLYLAMLALVIIGAGLYVSDRVRLGPPLMISGLSFIVIAFAMKTLYLPWKVRRLHRQQKDFGSPIAYHWDTEFLYGQHANGNTKRPWSHYSKVRESNKLLLLYHSDVLFEMFPKSWFADQSQLEEFKDLAMRSAGT